MARMTLSVISPRKCSHCERLFDHLVGRHLQSLWHGETEPLGGFEVDDQLEFGRQLNRQVGDFVTLEDAAGINARLPIGFGDARTVTHQPAGLGKIAEVISRRQPVSRRQFDQ